MSTLRMERWLLSETLNKQTLPTKSTPIATLFPTNDYHPYGKVDVERNAKQTDVHIKTAPFTTLSPVSQTTAILAPVATAAPIFKTAATLEHVSTTVPVAKEDSYCPRNAPKNAYGICCAANQIVENGYCCDTKIEVIASQSAIATPAATTTSVVYQPSSTLNSLFTPKAAMENNTQHGYSYMAKSSAVTSFASVGLAGFAMAFFL